MNTPYLFPELTIQDTRGFIIQVNSETWKQITEIFIKQNEVRGNHYHKIRKELFKVLNGNVELTKIDVKNGEKSTYYLRQGDYFRVEPFEVHALKANNADAVLQEFSSEQYDSSDVYKL